MVGDKATKYNGFPYEFYKSLWLVVVFDLHNQSLRKLINKRNIKFIPKLSFNEDICYW